MPLGAAAPTPSVDASRHRVICDAALALLSEVGYERMSMDSVAARAKASKATIYRHWSGKRELVIDAIRLRGPACPEVPDTGTLRGDIIATMQLASTGMLCEEAALLTGVLKAIRECPDLADVVRVEIMDSKKALFHRIAERAIARGELPPDCDRDVFHDVAPALVFFRISVLAEPIDDEFLTHVADDVLIPLMARSTASAPGAHLKESA